MSLGWKGEAPETRFLTLFSSLYLSLFFFFISLLKILFLLLEDSISLSLLARFQPYKMFVPIIFLMYLEEKRQETNSCLVLNSHLHSKLFLGPNRQTARSFGCRKVVKEWHQKSDRDI